MPRIFDIILALCGTVVLFIPCAIVAIILKKTGEGEIFYLQERIGRNRKPFKIYKFATMLKNSPNIGSGDITTGNDPRVLPIGKFLRKTKINELPQFINILNGSLRLVGPRPTTPKIFAMYPEEFKKVFDKISPGITGIGSVVFRDEESIIKNSSKDFMTCYQEDIIPYKARLEEWYVQNRSTLVDFKLIFLTAWAILFPRSDLHFKILPNLPRTADAPKPQKKILYVINHADWFWSHRLPLALAAKKSGWDVHVAVNGASDPKFKENGFTAHELSNTGIFIPLQIYRLIGKVQPEIMHAITLKYVFLAGIAALDHPNVKRVFTIAGLGYLFSGEGFKPKFLRALITPVLKIVLKGASIIVQNPDDRDILVESGLIKDCTLIRGSGVDTAQYAPAKNNENEMPVVLLPTRLIREKGVIVFIEAARILKARGVNAKFQIAGGMEGHNPNKISKEEMETLTADGATEWLGRVTDMPALYASAALIAYPSYYREGVPKVLLESAAMGKAIITTDHPGCREAVADNDNGLLVPVKDAQATADAIETLLKDPVRRKEMGARSRERAEKEFDVRLIVDQTLKVYEAA